MKNISAILVLLLTAILANAQTTSFTYQGKLNDGAMPANGTYQMQFEIYDVPQVGMGSQIGSTQMVSVAVVNGIFTVPLDFGDTPFATGQDRFLQISVRQVVTDPFATLSPRQSLTSAPYAIKAKNAETAVTAINSQQLGGINANQYIIGTDPRLTDERNPAANSENYIQNTTTQQTTSNFNISGEGKADIMTAATHFNIGANRILSSPRRKQCIHRGKCGRKCRRGWRKLLFWNICRTEQCQRGQQCIRREKRGRSWHER